VRRAALLALAASLPFTTSVAAQPSRDARRPATGAAVLTGTIVSDEFTPHPIRHARVVCAASDRPASVTAITDEQGRFTCARLPAGRYVISVTRDGWVGAAYGAARPLRPGSAVPLADGQRADVVLRMVRGAVITGTVLDERGQPAAGASVVALRATTIEGQRRMIATGSAGLTDDRGVYRIYGLAPGDYFVSAGPSGSALSLQDALTAQSDGRERHVALASTYYPGTAVPLEAAPIHLAASEERTDVDFALEIVPSAQVDGTLMMPDGTAPPPAAQLSLVPGGAAAIEGLAFAGLKTTRPDSQGVFSFSGVVPGEYTLLARLAATPVLWASTQIVVQGDPVSGLALALQPALSIAGTVRLEGSEGSRPPFGLGSIRIVCEPVQALGDIGLAPDAVLVDADGRFVVRGVVPGRYRLLAALPAAAKKGGWIQRAGVINGADTLDVPAAIAQSAGDAFVTLTDRAAHLSGRLPDSDGTAPSATTVVLFPTDPALRVPRSRRIQAVRADAAGAFAFDGLPPGDYLIALAEDVEPGEWQDPAFLARLVSGAVAVALGEGESRTAVLRPRMVAAVR
jgi:hypothetical protein